MRTARRWFPAARAVLTSALVLALGMIAAHAEPVVPGTGQKLAQVGDDFEDEGWGYLFNLPKGTRDIDEQDRFPAGEAANGRWYEGMRRGQPDVIKRVPTPEGGLPGSRGALLLQSLSTGIPGQPRNYLGQDDFIADVNYRLAGTIPAAWSPSVVVRVFLPPVDTWENRTGPHFGFRTALETNVVKSSPGVRFSQSRSETETYWPGIFIEFQSKASERDYDYAYLRIRANEKGEDFRISADHHHGLVDVGHVAHSRRHGPLLRQSRRRRVDAGGSSRFAVRLRIPSRGIQNLLLQRL